MPVTLVQQYPAQKVRNGCVACGIDNLRDIDTFVIDTGHTVDFEGAVMLCEQCGIEIANLIGYISPAKTEQLFQRIEALQATLEITGSIQGLHDDLCKTLTEFRALTDLIGPEPQRFIFKAVTREEILGE